MTMRSRPTGGPSARQPSIVMACLGQRRAASSTFSRSSSPRLVLEHVEEVVVAHLEHLGRGGHAQGVALAEVVVDDDAHVGSPHGSGSVGFLDRGTYSARVMPLTSDTLRIDEARRIALHAQGFNDPRPTGRVDRRHFRRVMDRLGLVQIDSVNVLTRSHELPFLARLGPYDRGRARPRWLWGSGEVFEYWDHEASLRPGRAPPAAALADGRRPRVGRDAQHGQEAARAARPAPRGRARARPGHARRARPPRRRHQAGQGRAREHVELERGQEGHRVALLARRGVGGPQPDARSAATTCCPSGCSPPRCSAAPTPTDDDAMKELLLLGARSHGVGTARCLADYHRLNIVTSRRLLGRAGGRRRAARRSRWRAGSTRRSSTPTPCCRAGCGRRRSCRRSTRSCGSAQRTEPLFDFRYRIEIYVPAAQRVHGYYVLPFLHDGRLVARVDLKADRQAGTPPRARRLRRADLGRRQGPPAARRAPRGDGRRSSA